MKNKFLAFLIVLSCAVFLFACSGGNRLQGTGASFPKPIYDKWVNEYTKLNPNVSIDYQSTGSGAGINAIQQGTADFAASDAAMNDEALKKAPAEIVHIPTVLGAVVMTYNIEGLNGQLRLSPDTIADIYLGKIKKWNDPKLKADNPTLNLPDKDIRSVHRAEASGTTDVFTDFLSKTSPEWKEKVGRNLQPSWVQGVGISAPRSDGVMGEISGTPNTIGYVELTFAKSKNLPMALIKNSAGNFVDATPENVATAAAESVSKTPDDLRVEITNASGANAYPIASYTYILLYKKQTNATKGKNLVDFLTWATHDGQKFAPELFYVPLPQPIVAKIETRLSSIEK